MAVTINVTTDETTAQSAPPSGGGGLRRAMHELADFSLKNLTALFALAALVFYVLGLGRRVAVVLAEGIPTSRAIPLASLQDYLIQGLAVIVDPSVLLVIASLVLVGFAIPAAKDIGNWLKRPTEQAEPAEDADAVAEVAPTPGTVGRLLAKVWILVLVILAALVIAALACILVFLPPAAWLPSGVTIVALFAVGFFAARFETWTPATAAAIVALAGLGYLSGEVVQVVLAPPPLDTAKVTPTTGEPETGELLSTANGAVYLVQREGDEPTITMYPFGQVRSMRISETPPAHYRSFANVIGLVDETWPPDMSSCDPYPGILGDICTRISN
jgi:hypothetical protein